MRGCVEATAKGYKQTDAKLDRILEATAKSRLTPVYVTLALAAGIAIGHLLM